jgi:hypothetical protein
VELIVFQEGKYGTLRRQQEAKEDSMPLIRVHPEPGALEFCLQASQHRIAIEAAVDYVNAGVARALAEHTNDSFWWSTEQDWVIETIYQGAYLRQYHLWEKGSRTYFLSQGVEISRNPTPNFSEHVKGILSSRFDLNVPKDVMDALSTMRCKVNRMKHEGGVQDDEFVSAADYAADVAAIERFWEFLAGREQLRV